MRKLLAALGLPFVVFALWQLTAEPLAAALHEGGAYDLPVRWTGWSNSLEDTPVSQPWQMAGGGLGPMFPGPGVRAFSGGGGGGASCTSGTPTLSDNFLRPDETPLAAPWTLEHNTFELISHAVSLGVFSSDTEMYYNSAIANDQYSDAAITVNAGSTSGTGFGVMTRMSAAAGGSGYRLVFSHDTSNSIELGARVGGTYGFIANRNQTFTDGQHGRLVSVGTSHLVCLNNVQVGASITDSQLSSGFAGLGYSSTVTSGKLEAWTAGTP